MASWHGHRNLIATHGDLALPGAADRGAGRSARGVDPIECRDSELPAPAHGHRLNACDREHPGVVVSHARDALRLQSCRRRGAAAASGLRTCERQARFDTIADPRLCQETSDFFSEGYCAGVFRIPPDGAPVRARVGEGYPRAPAATGGTVNRDPKPAKGAEVGGLPAHWSDATAFPLGDARQPKGRAFGAAPEASGVESYRTMPLFPALSHNLLGLYGMMQYIAVHLQPRREGP